MGDDGFGHDTKDLRAASTLRLGGDPLAPARGYLLENPSAEFALTFHAAAWARGWTRVPPPAVDAAFPRKPGSRVPDGMVCSGFQPKFSPSEAMGLPCLGAEEIVVHMAGCPGSAAVGSSVRDWLPSVAGELDVERLAFELEGRQASICACAAFLVRELRPDISDDLDSRLGNRFRSAFDLGGNAIGRGERTRSLMNALRICRPSILVCSRETGCSHARNQPETKFP